MAKREIEKKKFGKVLDEEDRKRTVFRVVKQIVKKNRDVVGESCVKDTSGRIVVEEEKLMEVWRKYCDKLSNEEFPWIRDALTEVGVVSGPCEEISFEEVRAAGKRMKNTGVRIIQRN